MFDEWHGDVQSVCFPQGSVSESSVCKCRSGTKELRSLQAGMEYHSLMIVQVSEYRRQGFVT